MKKKISLVLLVICIVIGGFAGITYNNNNNKEVSQEEQNNIVKDLAKMQSDGKGLEEIEKYIRDNIKKVNKDYASQMIVYLYYASGAEMEESRNVVMASYNELFEASKGIEDLTSKEFLNKVESSLGKEVLKALKTKHLTLVNRTDYLTLNVDSKYFKDEYSKYIQQDLSDFMDYLAGEGYKEPTIEAELLPVTVDNILNIQSYIDKNKDSAFVSQWAVAINDMLKFYYGLNNSELVDEHEVVKDVHITAYKEIAEKHKDLQIGKDTKEFVELLEKNSNKITDEMSIAYDKKITDNTVELLENAKPSIFEMVGSEDEVEATTPQSENTEEQTQE